MSLKNILKSKEHILGTLLSISLLIPPIIIKTRKMFGHREYRERLLPTRHKQGMNPTTNYGLLFMFYHIKRLMFVTLYSTIFKTPPPQALGTSFRQAQSWPPSMSNIRFMTGQMR